LVFSRKRVCNTTLATADGNLSFGVKRQGFLHSIIEKNELTGGFVSVAEIERYIFSPTIIRFGKSEHKLREFFPRKAWYLPTRYFFVGSDKYLWRNKCHGRGQVKLFKNDSTEPIATFHMGFWRSPWRVVVDPEAVDILVYVVVTLLIMVKEKQMRQRRGGG